MSKHPPIGVVIPYYQREPGILARALRSVARQQNVTDVRVVVVDDGSPAPAAAEIASLRDGFPFQLEVVAQTNGGPGLARNRALNVLAGNARYVAFLDSDDEWSKDHLHRALFALSRGFDAYFADHLQLGSDVSAFNRAGRLNPTDHPPIEGAEAFHVYRGDMFDQILRGNVIGTSTVVFDRQRLPEERFRAEFRNAGEDYLFWLELAAGGARFAFSSLCEAIYGRGVNVYARAGWGTETHFLRLHNEMRYRKMIPRLFAVSAPQEKKLTAAIRNLRHAIVRDVLHRIAHRKALPWSWARAHVLLDPQTFLLIPWLSVQVLFHK